MELNETNLTSSILFYFQKEVLEKIIILFGYVSNSKCKVSVFYRMVEITS